MTVYQSFSFDCAHRLTGVPPDHKCAAMHGHTYLLTVYITGEPDPETGMVIDYADLAMAVEPIVAEIDHKTLNDIEELSNPTTEVLTPWIGRQIMWALPGRRITVEVKESSTTGCIWESGVIAAEVLTHE